MSSHAILIEDNIAFGLLELDSTGTVIHFCSEGFGYVPLSRNNVIGKNFFTEIVAGEPGIDLKVQFEKFLTSESESLQKLDERYEFSGRPIRVQLLLSRKRKQDQSHDPLLALVRMTPGES